MSNDEKLRAVDVPADFLAARPLNAVPPERGLFTIVPFNGRINPEFEGSWERMREEIYSDRR